MISIRHWVCGHEFAALYPSPPPPPGGVPLEAVPDAREKKTRKKGIQIRGGRGTRKGCQKREKWEKGYPNRYDQNSSHAITRGKGI